MEKKKINLENNPMHNTANMKQQDLKVLYSNRIVYEILVYSSLI